MSLNTEANILFSPDSSKNHLPRTATAHLMAAHAGHKHIVLVQILKTNGASEHVVLVPSGAARSALCRCALSSCWVQHARPVKIWRCARIAHIEHLWHICIHK